MRGGAGVPAGDLRSTGGTMAIAGIRPSPRATLSGIPGAGATPSGTQRAGPGFTVMSSDAGSDTGSGRS